MVLDRIRETAHLLQGVTVFRKDDATGCRTEIYCAIDIGHL